MNKTELKLLKLVIEHIEASWEKSKNQPCVAGTQDLWKARELLKLFCLEVGE